MITAISVVTIALLSAAAEEPVVRPEFAALFDACEYRYTGGQFHDELFKYRLFVPRNLKPGERCPLLVWLPGLGENGSDNEKNLRWLNLIIRDVSRIEEYRFFILAVQCPTDLQWAKAPDSADDMVAVTHTILEKTLKEQPVDQDRIYVSGVSAGSSAVWEMALRFPSLFAAVVPMASGGGDPARAASLVDTPVWAFHNREDKATPCAGDEAMIAALQNAGGNAYLTLGWKYFDEVPEVNTGHDCWSKAVYSDQVMDWMLEQRRGQWICWTPPGHRLWKWWHVFGVPLAFISIVGLAWCSERRQQGRRNRRAIGKTPPQESRSQETS
jgi:predicted peptidase